MDSMHASLALLFGELIDGPSPDAAYMLNGGDPGLLRSLDRLSASAASKPPAPGAATIAAHVDHLCFGLELMLRWSKGEADPWTGGLGRELASHDGERAGMDRAPRTPASGHATLAGGAQDATRDVRPGAERGHRQPGAPRLSSRRHQADRPIDPGAKGRVIGPPGRRHAL